MKPLAPRNPKYKPALPWALAGFLVQVVCALIFVHFPRGIGVNSGDDMKCLEVFESALKMVGSSIMVLSFSVVVKWQGSIISQKRLDLSYS